MMSIAAVAVCQVFVTSLPVLVLNARGVSGTAAPSLTLLDVAGIVLWIGAWGLQVCLSALHGRQQLALVVLLCLSIPPSRCSGIHARGGSR